MESIKRTLLLEHPAQTVQVRDFVSGPMHRQRQPDRGRIQHVVGEETVGLLRCGSRGS